MAVALGIRQTRKFPDVVDWQDFGTDVTKHGRKKMDRLQLPKPWLQWGFLKQLKKTDAFWRTKSPFLMASAWKGKKQNGIQTLAMRKTLKIHWKTPHESTRIGKSIGKSIKTAPKRHVLIPRRRDDLP